MGDGMPDHHGAAILQQELLRGLEDLIALLQVGLGRALVDQFVKLFVHPVQPSAGIRIFGPEGNANHVVGVGEVENSN